MNVLKRFNSSRSIYNRPLNVPKGSQDLLSKRESYLGKPDNDNSLDTMLFALESAEMRGTLVSPSVPATNLAYVVAGYVVDGYVEDPAS